MRVKVEFRSSSKYSYDDFCKKNPTIKIPFDTWKKIIYTFSDDFRNYILETGERARLFSGFGEFSITKRKRKKLVFNKKLGREVINLPVDWKKTKEKGKKIYNFNTHTEGYYFGWKWFKSSTRLKFVNLWYFKPFRTSSRLITHYLNIDPKYKDLYLEWIGFK